MAFFHFVVQLTNYELRTSIFKIFFMNHKKFTNNKDATRNGDTIHEKAPKSNTKPSFHGLSNKRYKNKKSIHFSDIMWREIFMHVW